MRRLVAVVVFLVALVFAGSAQASVLWRASGATTLSNEWAEYSTASHCAVDSTGLTDPSIYQESSVVAPYNPDGHAYKATVSSTQAQCYGIRTEVGEALPSRGSEVIGSGSFTASRYFVPGHQYWVSSWLRLATGWPLSDGNWDNVLQFKTQPGSNAAYPLMLVQVFSGHVWWVDANTNQYWNLGAIQTNVWMKLTFHFLVSSSPSTGYVEAFGSLTGGSETRLMARAYMATTPTCASSCSSYGISVGSAMPDAARIGIYRNPVISGTATDYFDGYTVATTRTEAEKGAFG